MSAIVILGHSGAGKTSVGAWVAKHLDMPCIDTDVKVLEHLGKTSIQSVWDEEGEASWVVVMSNSEYVNPGEFSTLIYTTLNAQTHQ